MAGAHDLFSGSKALGGSDLYKVDKNPNSQIDQGGAHDVIGGQWQHIGESLTQAITGIVEAIVGIPGAILTDLYNFFSDLLAFLGDPFGLGSGGDVIGGTIIPLLQPLVDGILNATHDGLVWFFDLIHSQDGLTWVANTFDGSDGIITNSPQDGLGWLITKLYNLEGTIQDILHPSSIPDITLTMSTALGEVLDNIVNGLLGIFGLHWSQTMGLQALSATSDAATATAARLSALIASLTPGSASDDFERASDSNLGRNWAVTSPVGGFGSMTLDGHNAFMPGAFVLGASEVVCRWIGPSPDSATDNQRNACVLSTAPGGGVGNAANDVLARISADNNSYYRFRAYADRTLTLHRFNAGVPTLLGTGLLVSVGGPGAIGELIVGSDTEPGYLRCVVNSATVIEEVDATPLTGASQRGRGFGGRAESAHFIAFQEVPGKVNQFVGEDLTVTLPATGAPAPMGPPGTWTLDFEDHFSGTSLDTTKWNSVWNYDAGFLNGVTTVPGNVTVGASTLALRLSNGFNGAAITSDPDGGASPGYRMTTGVVEARIAFPGNGTDRIYNWPAFWLDGRTASVAWPTNGENDIAEVGAPGLLSVNYHGTATNRNTTPAGYWGDAFHVYTLHRKVGSCDVYWDGVLVASYATVDAEAPQFIILNIGSTFAGGPVHYGSDVHVDYVRAWV